MTKKKKSFQALEGKVKERARFTEEEVVVMSAFYPIPQELDFSSRIHRMWAIPVQLPYLVRRIHISHLT